LGCGAGIAGFSLSLTLRVCSFSGIWFFSLLSSLFYLSSLF
jgi:hypothetical protein